MYYEGMSTLLSLFRRKGKRFSGPVVDLVEERQDEADSSNNFVPSFFYGIYLHDKDQRVGYCDLRVGKNDELYYAGNIGYHINKAFRGRHYACEACRVLFGIAREKGMKDLIITCSPDNCASRKTCERLGGEFLETVDVPKTHWLYLRGEPVKRIYHYDLS